MRPRATALLSRLKAKSDVITWDKTGQVKIEGETIPGSNISDLVSDAMRFRKNFNPTGSKEFFQVLSKMNVPKDLVRNEERWKEVLGETSGTLATPVVIDRHFTAKITHCPREHFLKSCVVHVITQGCDLCTLA